MNKHKGKSIKNVKLLPKTNNKKRETKNHGSELTRFRFLGSAMNGNLISTCIFKFLGKNGTYIFNQKKKKIDEIFTRLIGISFIFLTLCTTFANKI